MLAIRAPRAAKRTGIPSSSGGRTLPRRRLKALVHEQAVEFGEAAAVVVFLCVLFAGLFAKDLEINAGFAIKDGAFVRYSGYEIASRLSYMLWASMPDEALFGLAEQNDSEYFQFFNSNKKSVVIGVNPSRPK